MTVRFRSPAPKNMNKFAFFDVDNTIHDVQSTLDFYFGLAEMNGRGEEIKAKTAQLFKDYRESKLDYTVGSKLVVDLQAESLAGLTTAEVESFGDEFMKTNAMLFPFVPDLFALLDEHGFETYLISGAASPVIEAIGRHIGTDRYFATGVEVESDIFTGKATLMLNDEEKKHALHRIMGDGPDRGMTLGFGDSTGDTEMLSIVDHAYVINPHQQEMINIAKEMGWELVGNDDIIEKVNLVLAK